MSRAILHIGTHKTGTTLIQKTFAANRELLARHGVIYPEIGRAAGHHSLLRPWHDMPPQYHTDVSPLELWRGLARFAKGNRTLFLSSEVFSRAAPPRVRFAEVRHLLAEFDDIHVICVLRDQLSLLQSLFFEVSRKHVVDFSKMMQMAFDHGRAMGVFMDYRLLLSHLLKDFAPGEIHFVDYAQARRAPGGLLGRMLEICGAPAALPETAPPDANVSPDPLAFWLARGRCPEGPVPPRLLAEARATLAEKFGPGRRSTLYTRSEYRNLTAHFAPLNAAFQARLETFQPGFTLSPPETLPEDTIWREDVAELPEKAPGERT